MRVKSIHAVRSSKMLVLKATAGAHLGMGLQVTERKAVVNDQLPCLHAEESGLNASS